MEKQPGGRIRVARAGRGGYNHGMKRAISIIFVVPFFLMLAAADSGDAEQAVNSRTRPDEAVEQVTGAVIPCKDLIDDGLYESITRRTGLAVEAGADYVVYEIDTYGGLVQAADDIGTYFIHEAAKDVHTVAYVSKKAISAGALISVSCQDIVMKENTTIGDCAPITMGGTLEGVEREKAESFIRAAFVRAAEANGYPVALLKAMVSMQIKVYRVKNLSTGEFEFFEDDHLPDDPNEYDLADKEVVVDEDEILTLTASQALKYDVARTVVEDRQGVFDFLAERDGVEFIGEPAVLEPNWSEQMVRWLNSPAVLSILFMLGLLGVYVELNTPGLGLPGLVAVICFAIIFGSKYLVGMANYIEVLLFAAGVLLILVEIFVIPGFGIAGLLGIACLLAGLFGILVWNPPDEIPWPTTEFDWQVFTNGALALSGGFAGFVVLAWLLSRYIPRMQFFSGLILAPSAAKAGDEYEVSFTAPPEESVERPPVNVGDVGVVLSPLRPAGTARFGSAVVDVVSEAAFLSTGAKVKVVDIHGNRVVVREVKEE